MRATVITLISLLVLAAACGDDSEGEPNRFPELESAEPLELSSVDLGIGFEHGSARGVSLFRPDFMPDIVETFPHAIVRVQSYDEASQRVGEYRVITPPGDIMGEYRGPLEFRDTDVASGRFQPRVDDIYAEVDIAIAESSAPSFASTSIILETWRLKRDWHVRWDGTFTGEGNNRNKGNYGFFREDFRNDLLDQVEAAAELHQPRYFILGTEIERLFGTDAGPGIAPGEYANFVSFYREAATRIREVSPDTRIGAGVNWLRFAGPIADAYGNPETMSRDELMDRAFERFMLPLIEAGDIIALHVYRGPVDEGPDPTDRFQFLRRINDLYGIDAPIVYYEVGSPIDASVEYQIQRTFMEQFLEWNAGVPVEYLAWRNATNYDGTDTNDQSIQGRCATMTEMQLAMPVERCFDGLLSSVFQKKPIFEFFEEN